MADKERTYIINVRKEVAKVPRYKKTSKAVKAVRNFIKKHMKNEDVRLGNYLNAKIWSQGNKHPPVKYHIKATEKEDEKNNKHVFVELVDAPVEVKKETKKKKSLKERLLAKKETKEEKAEEKTEEKKEKPTKEEKPVKEEKPKKEKPKKEPKKKADSEK